MLFISHNVIIITCIDNHLMYMLLLSIFRIIVMWKYLDVLLI